MGRKRKDFSDKFKIEVAKEALKKRAKETEVAAKYNIAPSTLGKFQDSCRRKLKNYAEFFSGFSTSNSEILY
ncbi:MAG: transposase [Methanobrevibacter sp.]